MKNFKILSILACIVFLTSCSNSDNENKSGIEVNELNPSNSQNVYYINFQDVIKNGDSLKVIAYTNFPKNTVLNISVNRPYKRIGIDEDYEGVIFKKRDYLTDGEEINFSTYVNNDDWVNKYKETQDKWGAEDKELTDIETIEDSLRISILYTPKAEQPESVKKILGTNGELLNNSKSKKTSNFYVLMSDTTISFNK